MENTICKIFNNSEFGTLEVISIDGKDYFPIGIIEEAEIESIYKP